MPTQLSLWNGAASTIIAKGVFRDVSYFRLVPDNQEVFVEQCEDMKRNDSSIIFEVVEIPLTPDLPLLSYLTFSWNDYSTDESILKSEVLSIKKHSVHPDLYNVFQNESHLCEQLNGVHFVTTNKRKNEKCYLGNNLVQDNQTLCVSPVIISLSVLRFPVNDLNMQILYHLPLNESFSLMEAEKFMETTNFKQYVKECSQFHQNLLSNFRIHHWDVFNRRTLN